MRRFLILLMFSGLPGIAFAKDLTVHVKGMVCAFCGQGITKKFGARDEVEKVTVSLEKKTVVLSLKEGKDLPDAVIGDLLKEAGYAVERVDR